MRIKSISLELESAVIKEKKVRGMGNQVGLIYKSQPQDESVKWPGKIERLLYWDVPREFVRIKIYAVCLMSFPPLRIFQSFYTVLQKSHVEQRTSQRFKLYKNTGLDKHRFLFGKTIQNTCGISYIVEKISALLSSKSLIQENIFSFTKNIIILACIPL
jgi:hypothetical protein